VTDTRDPLPAPHGASPLVEVRQVSHDFVTEGQARRVLERVDLEVRRGEFIALTGPSGAGKTTLLTLVGALRSIQSGAVRFDGEDLARLGPRQRTRVRRRIGFIFQDHNLFNSLTAEQTLVVAMRLFAARYTRADYRERPRYWLAQLGLAAHAAQRPPHLSTGQKQRVAIARALINEPHLVIADEPTASLDRARGEEVITLLRRVARDSGVGVLMVSHDQRQFRAVDRVVEMVDGRIASDRPGGDGYG
jgi:putative ABC transport system ATP-binding protein